MTLTREERNRKQRILSNAYYHRNKNDPEFQKKRKQYVQKLLEKNPDYFNQKNKEQYQNNPEKHLRRLEYQRNYQAATYIHKRKKKEEEENANK